LQWLASPHSAQAVPSALQYGVAVPVQRTQLRPQKSCVAQGRQAEPWQYLPGGQSKWPEQVTQAWPSQ
jgi:hypothetical protein